MREPAPLQHERDSDRDESQRTRFEDIALSIGLVTICFLTAALIARLM